MNDPANERWKELCQQAAGEQDPKKLVQLVREITRLLEAKQNINGERSTLAEPTGK